MKVARMRRRRRKWRVRRKRRGAGSRLRRSLHPNPARTLREEIMGGEHLERRSEEKEKTLEGGGGG